MNKTRAKINLIAVNALSDRAKVLFNLFFSSKGRNFDRDKLLEKCKDSFYEDKEDSEKEADQKKAKARVTKTINELVAAELIVEVAPKEGATPKELKDYAMEAYDISDLPAEMQLGIGGKVHTTLTANSSRVPYVGQEVVMKNHPLSKLGKAGVPVTVGHIKNWHINEEGALYANVYLPLAADAKEGAKRETCAKKVSTLQFISDEIPTEANVGVTYKKKANLKEPTLIPFPEMKGRKGVDLIEFNAAWSPYGVHLGQILDSLTKEGPLKGKFNRTTINTDHQVEDCKRFNILHAPTMILFKDGKEVGRMDGLPSEDVNAAIFNFIKKVAAPKASAPKEAKKEETAKA